jgi:hypothetical protein
MSRSTYVYVLVLPGRPPLARTVKAEMRSWLQRHPDTAEDPGARLYRCHDGYSSAEPGLMVIADVLAGK